MVLSKADVSGPAMTISTFRTKAEMAAEHIRGQILAGRLRVGDRVVSREIAAQTGFSETPVREAVLALAAEGWLEAAPHSGGVVATIRNNEIREVYAMRGVLAAVAIEVGGAHITKATITAIENNIDDAREAVEANDPARYAAINREFHRLLADTPATQRTLRVLLGLWAQTAAMSRGFELVPERMEQSLAEHRQIIDAVANGEFARAAALVIEHERTAGEALLSRLG